MSGYDDLGVDDLRAELALCDRALESLLDKFVAAVEADDWPWSSALLVALKTQVARKKHLKRCLASVMEIA